MFSQEGRSKEYQSRGAQGQRGWEQLPEDIHSPIQSEGQRMLLPEQDEPTLGTLLPCSSVAQGPRQNLSSHGCKKPAVLCCPSRC